MPPKDRQSRRTSSPTMGGGRSSKSDSAEEGGLGEVYFEFRAVGAYMRVNAIHAATGKETFVLGPLKAHRGDLQVLAMRKLRNLLGAAST